MTMTMKRKKTDSEDLSMADKLSEFNGCGDEECSTSIGICLNLTFGKGHLSVNGYWETPCETCEDAWINQFGTTQIADTVDEVCDEVVNASRGPSESETKHLKENGLTGHNPN